MSPAPTCRGHWPVVMALAAAVAYGVLAGVSAQAQGPLWALKIGLGLVVLLWLPGLPWAYLALRGPRVRWLDLAGASGLLGLVFSIALTSAAKALGGALTHGLYLGLTAGATLVGLAVAWPRLRSVRVVQPAWSGVVATGLGCAVVAAYPLITSQPRLVDEDHYWPIDLLPRVALMDFGEGLCPSSVQWVASGQPQPGHRWRLAEGGGALVLRNDGPGATAVSLRLLVEVHGESRFELWQGERRLVSLYAPPRFELSQHPRNYPPPNFLVEQRLTLPPGRSVIHAKLAPWPRPGHRAHAVVTNVTVSTRGEFWRRFRERYLCANTGDTREQISLARSLLTRPFLYSYSFNGSVFDGGGYTISNLPAPYYLSAFALALLGDSLLSLHALYLGLLCGLYVLMVSLAGQRLRSGRGPAQLVALFPVLAYATVMRFMVESLYVHTVLTVLVLLALHFVRRRRPWLVGLALTFLLLTKGGLVVACLVLIALAALRPRGCLRGRPLWAAAAGAGAVAVGLLLCSGVATGSLGAWLGLAKGTDYAGRFSLLTQALTGGGSGAWRILFGASADLTLRALLVACLLPLGLFLGRDRFGLALLLAGAAFHLVVCASDVVWARLGSHVHPLNYFTPTAVLWAIAGGRALLACRRRAYVLVVPVGVLCLVACQHYMAGYERHFALQGLAQREDLTLVVNDYLLRRGAGWLSMAGSRPQAFAMGEAYLTEATGPRPYAAPDTLRLRAQRATVLCRLAQAWERQGDRGKARAFAQQALEAWPDCAPALELLERCSGP